MNGSQCFNQCKIFPRRVVIEDIEECNRINHKHPTMTQIILLFLKLLKGDVYTIVCHLVYFLEYITHLIHNGSNGSRIWIYLMKF